MSILELNENCFYPLFKGIHYVYDNNNVPSMKNIPQFVTKRETWNLCIINKKSKIKFYQNDECLMKNTNNQKDGSQVDWICFGDNDFYFIEAKEVKRRKNIDKKDVENKFINSLNFYNSIYNLQQLSKNIYWILSIKSPRKTINTGDQIKKERYLTEFNVNYNETNIICFKN